MPANFTIEFLYDIVQILFAVHIPDRVTLSARMCASDVEEETSRPPGVADRCFLIGEDEAGHWVALEAHGKGGGIFVDQQSAFRYAVSETDRRQGAVQFSERPLSFWTCAFGAPAAEVPSDRPAPPVRSLTGFILPSANPSRAATRRPNRSLIRWWPRLRRKVRLALAPLSRHPATNIRDLREGKAI
jgi:hypothetical protein